MRARQPYRNENGALQAIRFAREQRRPFLGTCGGFQHAVLEYARNVMGWADAAHGETDPEAERALLTPLSCALVETIDSLQLEADSLIAKAYGRLMVFEGYHCRFGVNPDFEKDLFNQRLHAVAGTRPAACERWSCWTIRSLSPRCSSLNVLRWKGACLRWSARLSKPAPGQRHERSLLRRDFHVTAH